MLRINLLLTTAFVVAGSLALLATQDWAVARSATAEPARDRNEGVPRHLWSGHRIFDFRVQQKQTSHSGYIHTVRHRQYVEVPIVGKGQTINSIIVKEWASNASGQPFSATIYSSSGYVAYGTATAHSKHPFAGRDPDQTDDAEEEHDLLDRGNFSLLHSLPEQGLLEDEPAHETQGLCRGLVVFRVVELGRV